MDDPAPLGELAWTDLAERAGRTLLAVPLGSTEQHGPHLPLATDTLVATALARRLAEARADVVLAPALPYGSSGEHAGFPGTLSLGQAALETVLVELVRSADDFAGVVVVNGHGGNVAALSRAVATLRSEGRRALAWSPSVPGGDAHAGRTETSLVLALVPHLARMPAAVAGPSTPVGELMPALRSGGVRPLSPTGVLGDPSGASAAEGEDLLRAMAAELVAAVDRWSPADEGAAR